MVLGEDIPLGNPLDLAFAEHVHGFITLDCTPRRRKRPEPLLRIHTLLDGTVVLLNNVVQVLHLPVTAAPARRAVMLHFSHCPRIRRRRIFIDDPG